MHVYACRLGESEKGSVRHEFLIYDDQTGTASSSPDIRTPSPTIINVMLWMKKNAYEDTTIKQIRLYDFRHFIATIEYHKTKDLLHVKALLGHKDLRTTLRYTQLLESLENDEYHCKTANNIKEATQLIENGFEYVTEIDGTKLFKKRK
jgi:integrase